MPPPYVLALARARHNQITQLLDVGRKADAVALLGDTLDGYRHYARLGSTENDEARREAGLLAPRG